MDINLKDIKKAHFIGVGGIGMSAIAHVMLDLGYEISGSDLAGSERLDLLNGKGAHIIIGQSSDNITDDIDCAVYSTAIQHHNVEKREAINKNIPVVHRSEMLGALMRDRKAVCVAGSHGKTTTSSMISLILEKNNLDPTIVVGGVINEIGSNAKVGKGEFFVAEADESDGSFVNLHPWYSIVTNIEEDHLDHFKDINEIREIFKKFLHNNANDGHVLLCADCEETMKMKEESPASVTTYGYSEHADYQIRNWAQRGRLNEADLYKRECFVGHIVLEIPGQHNIANATAAIVCAMELGLSFEQAANVLCHFLGTKRRFQLAGMVNDIRIIDDYAHHPTEIKATIKAARNCHDGRVVAIFQPHRYSRTKSLAKQFAQALSLADKVYLLDVYPAGEAPIPGVSSQLIADDLPIEKNGGILEESTLSDFIKDILKPGDMVLVMGAGSVWQQAPKIVEALKEKYIY